MRIAQHLTAALALAGLLGLSGCVGENSSAIGRSAVTVAQESRAESGRKYTLGPQYEMQLEEMISQEAVALGVKESVPMELNRQVLLNINYFLNNARGFMTKGLSRGSKYIPMMKAIFRQKGLPEDLVYLALIESGFRTEAVSHASAVGPWQFISATGRRYGLTINEWVDERQDPVKSTFAAADYLTNLHDMFGSWPLAIAAYNSGEGKIIKGMKNYGVNNFWDMSDVGGHLAAETKLYVPSFLAATFIAKDPAAYGLTIETQPPDQWDEVVVPAPVTLAEAAKFSDTTVDRLKDLNPHLKKDATPPDEADFVLRIPAGTMDQFAKAYGRAGKGGPALASAGSSREHVVKKDETLESVAALYGLAPQELADYNKIKSAKLKAGSTLHLPASVSVADKAEPAAPRPSVVPVIQVAGSDATTSGASPRLSNITHKVQAGDTLGSIAKLYGTTIDTIRANNGLKSSTVKTGQILKIRSDLPLTAQKSGASGPVMVVETEAAPRTATVHTVAAGENLGVIAQKYNMSVRELADINNIEGVTIRVGQKLTVNAPAGQAAREAVAPAASAKGAVHTVAAGESLGGIARKYGLSTRELMTLNGLKDSDIRAGQKLKVAAETKEKEAPATSSAAPAKPASAPGGLHTVAAGESLGVIAEKYGMKTKDLMALNGLKDSDIRIGQKLKVAGGGPATAPAKPAPAASAAPAKPASAPGGIHTVAAGESLGVIAGKYGMKTKALMALNDLKDSDIRIGQKLKVAGGGSATTAGKPAAAPAAKPAAQKPAASKGPTYQVAEGDTLYSIARKNGLSVDELKKINGLEGTTVRPGQTLKLK